MRIDWTQTLIGSSASFSEPSGEGAGRVGHCAPASGMPASREAARFAGMFASIAFIGLAIMALPARGLAATLPDVMALSGVLVANVLGFLMPSRFGATGWRLAAACLLLSVPFSISAGLAPVAVFTLAIVALLDGYLMLFARADHRLERRLLVLMASIGVSSVIGSGLVGPGGAAVLIVALLPVVIGGLYGARPASEVVTEPEELAEIARLKALVGALTRGAERQVFITDVVGTLDLHDEPEFRRHLGAQMFPEGSIVSAALIADRVSLLNALSRAVHRGETSEGLTIRLRREPAGAGYPVPPRFETFDCAVYPIPGRVGRVIVAIKGIGEAPAALEVVGMPTGPMSGVPMSAAPRMPEEALLARALHDASAPFNAGLGFLEMIADPRLAPRDIATYRDFAAEAHKAISEAHRNSVLLGRWLRTLQEYDHAAPRTVEIAPNRLVNDAIRSMNLRDAAERGEIRLVDLARLPAARVHLGAARFALEALLRFAHRHAQSEIRVESRGQDLAISCRSTSIGASAPECAEVDAFQLALEAAIAGVAPIVFGSEEPGERNIRFAGAFAATLACDIAEPAPVVGLAMPIRRVS